MPSAPKALATCFSVSAKSVNEVILFLERALLRDLVVTDANHRHPFVGQLLIGVPQRATLFSAAGRVRLRIEVNERVVILGVDIGEIEVFACIRECGSNRRRSAYIGRRSRHKIKHSQR